MVITSFLRLVTHLKIFVRPTPTAERARFLDSIMAAPGVAQPALGAEWPTLRKLCADKAFSANDVPDAWFAAAIIHQGEHLVSFDAGFERLLPKAQLTRLWCEGQVNFLDVFGGCRYLAGGSDTFVTALRVHVSVDRLG